MRYYGRRLGLWLCPLGKGGPSKSRKLEAEGQCGGGQRAHLGGVGVKDAWGPRRSDIWEACRQVARGTGC